MGNLDRFKTNPNLFDSGTIQLFKHGELVRLWDTVQEIMNQIKTVHKIHSQFGSFWTMNCNHFLYIYLKYFKWIFKKILI